MDFDWQEGSVQFILDGAASTELFTCILPIKELIAGLPAAGKVADKEADKIDVSIKVPFGLKIGKGGGFDGSGYE